MNVGNHQGFFLKTLTFIDNLFHTFIKTSQLRFCTPITPVFWVVVEKYKYLILYNYPSKGRWIVVDIYWDVKCRGIYPPLFTDPEGDNCFSIYQIRWIRKCRFINGHNFFFWNFRETTRHFSLRLQNSECPRIFQVTGANQNARKLLSTDLVNTNNYYYGR